MTFLDKQLPIEVFGLAYPTECVEHASRAIMAGDENGYLAARTALENQLAPAKYEQVGNGRFQPDLPLEHAMSPASDLLNILFARGVSTLLPRQTGRLVDILCRHIEKDVCLGPEAASADALTASFLRTWFERTYRIHCSQTPDSSSTVRHTNLINLQGLKNYTNYWRTERGAQAFIVTGLESKRSWRRFLGVASRIEF